MGWPNLKAYNHAAVCKWVSSSSQHAAMGLVLSDEGNATCRTDCKKKWAESAYTGAVALSLSEQIVKVMHVMTADQNSLAFLTRVMRT